MFLCTRRRVSGCAVPPTPRWTSVVPAGATRRRRRLARARHDGDAKHRGAATDVGRQSAVQGGELPTPTHLDAVSAAPAAHYRPGSGQHRPPEIPQPVDLPLSVAERLFRTSGRGQEALHLLLERMSQGGIYDHLGGGYARYAYEGRFGWCTFEKMRYDNAQILELHNHSAHAQLTHCMPRARRRAVGWMIRDMTALRGRWARAAFAASEGHRQRG